MSVRPELAPTSPSLRGSEGELVSVCVCAEPRLLEKLLEALACLPFPINPQIYHQAGIGYVHPDGREEREPATMVEFPAFSEHLDEVRAVIRASGLVPEAVYVRNMFDQIHSDYNAEAAPDSAPHRRVNLYRNLP